MHVLVATTGVLSPGPCVEFTSRLLNGVGRVTVTTVIEVPRSFLEHLGADRWHPLAEDGGAGRSNLEDDALLAKYVEERGRKITDPIVHALQAAGIGAEAVFLDGADPAVAISDLADELDADVVLLGATRQIFDQSAWESVSARVMIESGRAVLVVPPAHKDAAAQAVSESD
ncbi:MAG TPA: universal stress protein [Acidimicrobiia bacterium]|jgi:nucleotide-binding universal stress UspA family protein